jgi:error-prone DNA polymerase
VKYAELQCTTNYSFLRGASHPDEYFMQAEALGTSAIGVVDRNSLAGVVKAHAASKTHNIRLVVGCRLDLTDHMPVLVYPTDKAAYSRLCRLLSIGKSRGGKGKCLLAWADLCQWSKGLLAVLLPEQADDDLRDSLNRLKVQFGNRAYIALTLRRRPNDQLRLWQLNQAAQIAKVATVVTNDVLYHDLSRRLLQDVVTCIREKCTLDRMGFKRERYADRFLKPPEEMARLFKNYPEALARTMEIADRCRFSLDELRYQYPEEACIPGMAPQAALEKLTWGGAAWRYPQGVPDKVNDQLQYELSLIRKLDYANYFLTVRSIVHFARSKGILCQGRGSAANSAVCFVLGITSINPEHSNLLFERFISEERNEPPDIDVDFEHERREEVIQWIYETYGRDRAALTAVVITYRMKAALRDVAKVMGLSEDVAATISKQVWAWGREGIEEKHLRGLNLNRRDRRLILTLQMAEQLAGFPRHLSQHPGGFVLTNDRLDDLVPVEPARMENRRIIEWDKNDIDTLKFMKVDVLGLGMLGAMNRCFNLLRHDKQIDLDIADIPPDDKPTYDMICRADTIGVFQIESRAQMTMLPRIKPRCLYDLTIEVAIVRPGPIQGDMVHPYLRRRDGLEKAHLPSPELEDVLGKTLGVPLFQEQAMSIAIRCAGFTPGEADQLRRAMATFKYTGGVSRFRDKFINGMLARNYAHDFAERCFAQIEGFGSYGFPESHAASFALLAYASSWLKCHHPDAFCCALLNAQPMGFYAPPQLIGDAKAHGVTILPIDINHSHWDSTLEKTPGRYMGVRLGLRLVNGLSNDDGAMLVAARGGQLYDSIEDLQLRSFISGRAIDLLAKADAFKSVALNRRRAHWGAKALADNVLPLFAERRVAENLLIEEPAISLPQMATGREVMEDYAHTGLTLRQHPLTFLRDRLEALEVVPNSILQTAQNGIYVRVAGLVLVRQKPGSAKGVMFMTIEDETGLANLIIWPKLFDHQQRLLLSSRLVLCAGILQREGQVTHVVARRFIDQDHLLQNVASADHSDALIPNDEVRAADAIDFGLKNLVIRAKRNHMLREKAYGIWTECSIWVRGQLFAGQEVCFLRLV